MHVWFSISVMIALCVAAGIALARKNHLAFLLTIVSFFLQGTKILSSMFQLTGLLSAVLDISMFLSIALLIYFLARGSDREFLKDAIIEIEPETTNEGAKADP